MEYTKQEILILVKKKMSEQGAYDRDAYAAYIAETIDYFIEKGKLTDDDDLTAIEEQLLSLWPEVESELSVGKN
jgi:hypothetical protein